MRSGIYICTCTCASEARAHGTHGCALRGSHLGVDQKFSRQSRLHEALRQLAPAMLLQYHSSAAEINISKSEASEIGSKFPFQKASGCPCKRLARYQDMPFYDLNTHSMVPISEANLTSRLDCSHDPPECGCMNEVMETIIHHRGGGPPPHSSSIKSMDQRPGCRTPKCCMWIASLSLAYIRSHHVPEGSRAQRISGDSRGQETSTGPSGILVSLSGTIVVVQNILMWYVWWGLISLAKPMPDTLKQLPLLGSTLSMSGRTHTVMKKMMEASIEHCLVRSRLVGGSETMPKRIQAPSEGIHAWACYTCC